MILTAGCIKGAERSSTFHTCVILQVCKPYNQPDVKWHPVTPDMGKINVNGPQCCRDVRVSKGTINAFFSRAAAGKKGPQPQLQSKTAGSGDAASGVKRERQDDGGAGKGEDEESKRSRAGV